MLALTQVMRSFPTARLPSASGGLPVEVSLIAQLGIGVGDQLFDSVCARQRAHEAYIDALDEPSARLGGVDLERGDATSLYTFAVGAKGHPFHRHAGHRIFTAISGSGGAQLRFSSATPEDIERDPHAFLRALRYVDIPPDSLFTVRFGGGTWHQFAPRDPDSPHPAFFALSCHTNELGGALPDHLRELVAANAASIPALTEVLPDAVAELLRTATFDVPRIALSLHAPAGSLRSRLCTALRGALAHVRVVTGRLREGDGFLSSNGGGRRVDELAAPPVGSLLRTQLADRHHHEDCFRIAIPAGDTRARSASTWLEALLEGFLENRSVGVTQLMRLRNFLVRPLRLRTSPLGCPVSSLLCENPLPRFASRFPVLAQVVAADDRRAQVILGADDRHLRFRSCVGVEVHADGSIDFTLGTRVACRNAFGRVYLALIDRVHRHYIAPTMLRLAVDHAVRRLGEAPVPTFALRPAHGA